MEGDSVIENILSHDWLSAAKNKTHCGFLSPLGLLPLWALFQAGFYTPKHQLQIAPPLLHSLSALLSLHVCTSLLWLQPGAHHSWNTGLCVTLWSGCSKYPLSLSLSDFSSASLSLGLTRVQL